MIHSIRLGRLFLECGWFWGEEPRVFDLTILRLYGDNYVAILGLQIGKFAVCIDWGE